jgi:hypothetical protein
VKQPEPDPELVSEIQDPTKKIRIHNTGLKDFRPDSAP